MSWRTRPYADELAHTAMRRRHGSDSNEEATFRLGLFFVKNPDTHMHIHTHMKTETYTYTHADCIRSKTVHIAR